MKLVRKRISTVKDWLWRHTAKLDGRNSRPIIVMFAAVIVGVVLLIATHAASPTASLEAENGTLTGSGIKGSDATASNSGYVKFGNTVTTSGVPVVKVGGGANAGQFVDANNNVIQLRGVGVPGLEIGCANQYPGTIMQSSDGSANYQNNPTGYLNYYNTVVNSLLKWDNPNTPATGPHAVNVVRLPLNEECWLGINQAASGQTALLYSKVSGAPYQQFVKNLVDLLTAKHMYVILDLHIGANGTNFNDSQTEGDYVQPLDANSDHSIDFWDQVSKAFNSNNGYPNVIYGLQDEPAIRCLVGSGCPYGDAAQDITSAGGRWVEKLHRDGGNYTVTANDWNFYGQKHVGMIFPVAGTQNMLNKIRSNNAPNVAIVNGNYGGGPATMQYMGAFLPKDTQTPAQVGVEMHSYTGYGSDVVWNEGTYTWDMANGTDENGTVNSAYNILGHYPLLFGEVGAYNGTPTSGFPNPYGIANPNYWTVLFSIMNQHKWSYVGYGWTTVQGSNNMLTDFNNATPLAPEGTAFKTELQSKQGQL